MVWMSVTNLEHEKHENMRKMEKRQLPVPDIANGGGPEHPHAGIDDKHEGEEENGNVYGNGDRPVLLGQKVQTSTLKRNSGVDKMKDISPPDRGRGPEPTLGTAGDRREREAREQN